MNRRSMSDRGELNLSLLKMLFVFSLFLYCRCLDAFPLTEIKSYSCLVALEQQTGFCRDRLGSVGPPPL